MLEFEYNLTLCPVGVDSNTFSMGSPKPESTLRLWIWSAAGLLVPTLVRLSMGKDDPINIPVISLLLS
jgi:hypothetical protein